MWWRIDTREEGWSVGSGEWNHETLTGGGRSGHVITTPDPSDPVVCEVTRLPEGPGQTHNVYTYICVRSKLARATEYGH